MNTATVIDYPDPELQSDRIVLRKWSLEDLDCVEAASDAGYSRGSTLPERYSVDEGGAWIERQWARQTNGTGLSMAIARRDDGTAIGMIHLGLKGPEGHATLGYWLVPDMHRRGLGSEAVQLASRWLLLGTPIYRLVAYVEPENQASTGLLRKCGFTEEGLLRSYLNFDDGVFDAVCFSLLSTDLD